MGTHITQSLHWVHVSGSELINICSSFTFIAHLIAAVIGWYLDAKDYKTLSQRLKVRANIN